MRVTKVPGYANHVDIQNKCNEKRLPLFFKAFRSDSLEKQNSQNGILIMKKLPNGKSIEQNAIIGSFHHTQFASLKVFPFI